MSNRKLILGLIASICLATVATVLISRNIPLLQMRAARFFSYADRSVDRTRQLASGSPTSPTSPRSPTSPTSPSNGSPAQTPGLGGNNETKTGPSGSSTTSRANPVSDSGNNNNNNNNSSSGAPAQKTPLSSPSKDSPPQPTNRPMLCQGCFFSDFPSLLENPDVCSQATEGTAKPELIMMITSSLDGFERRQAIRDTWASVSKNNTAHVRHVFLLGTRRKTWRTCATSFCWAPATPARSALTSERRPLATGTCWFRISSTRTRT